MLRPHWGHSRTSIVRPAQAADEGNSSLAVSFVTSFRDAQVPSTSAVLHVEQPGCPSSRKLVTRLLLRDLNDRPTPRRTISWGRGAESVRALPRANVVGIL